MKCGTQKGRVARFKLVRALALLLLMTEFPLVAPAGEIQKPKRVLVLYWYGKDFPSNVEFDRGVQAAFRTARIEYYAEYFEPNRFPGEVQATVFRDYLHRKYSERKIDVVIAMSAVSADFLLKYRDDLFPDAPIVLETASRDQLNARAADIDSTGVVPENVYARTLETALRLHPATEHVFVINGTIDRDKSVEVLFKERLKVFENKVAITYLTDLPLDKLLSRVKSLPERSLILYSRQDYDSPSGSLSPLDVLILINNSATVPIYTFAVSYIGYGTIGGYAVNTYECGFQAAGMALQIIYGSRPRDLPVIEVPGLPIFDWPQLRRWGILENSLPSGSNVRFREATPFEQYKWRMIGTLTLCAVQTFLIAGLLAERKRRRRAQAAFRERLEFETLLSELSADFTNLPLSEIDRGIEKWLQRLVEFLGARSGSLFKLSDNSTSSGRRLNDAGRRAARSSSSKTAWHHSTDGQPGQAPPDAVLNVPIHVNGSTWTLAFSASRSRRIWPEDLLPRLRLAGEIFVGALVRKVSGEALLESQERYKLATSSGGVFVWDWDLQTSELYADPLLKSFLGYEDQEIRDDFDDWVRLVHPEDVNLVLERARAHIHFGAPRFEAEHRFVQKDGGVRWFLASGTVVQNDRGTAVRMVGTDTDITERKHVEQELQHLSARLLDLQDQERQRIARELHDGTAQNICAIGLNLEYLMRSLVALPARFQQTLSECNALCDQSLREIRSLAYMLHPPVLDKAGLHAAVSWYLDGFTKRSGIDVDLIATRDVGRLPPEIEMDLFRIVQECLANVHRHSGSRTAQVWMERQTSQVVLRVQDHGRGMPAQTAPAQWTEPDDSRSFGVGLSGMRQRLRHVGGHLEIVSNNQGTTVTAVVPLRTQTAARPALDTKSLENQEAGRKSLAAISIIAP
jgi:PAS domain S-box-containing protein